MSWHLGSELGRPCVARGANPALPLQSLWRLLYALSYRRLYPVCHLPCAFEGGLHVSVRVAAKLPFMARARSPSPEGGARRRELRDLESTWTARDWHPR